MMDGRREQMAKKAMKAMIDLARTRFIVFAWPDHCWPVQLINWLDDLTSGIETTKDWRTSVSVKNIVCARNYAIENAALQSDQKYRQFVFVDKDVKPTQHSIDFLKLDSDVKCCQMAHRSPRAWSRPDSFHEAFWCTRRDVLEAIEPPWFEHTYNAHKTKMLACLCQSFRAKALAAGFSISHGGWAEHGGDQSWCG